MTRKSSFNMALCLIAILTLASAIELSDSQNQINVLDLHHQSNHRSSKKASPQRNAKTPLFTSI